MLPATLFANNDHRVLTPNSAIFAKLTRYFLHPNFSARSLDENEKIRIRPLEQKLEAIGSQATLLQGGQQDRKKKQGGNKYTVNEHKEFFNKILKSFQIRSEDRKKRGHLSLPKGIEMPYNDAQYMGQMLALVEMFVYIDVIIQGWSHQQISRYPTQIGSVDSGEMYVRHRKGVKGLLKKIYVASEMLMKQLDEPSLLIQNGIVLSSQPDAGGSR